MITGD